MVRFISEHKDRFGVEADLPRADSARLADRPVRYYGAARRTPSGRTVRGEQLKALISRAHQDNYCVYGGRKIWLQLNREGTPVGPVHSGAPDART